MEYIKGDLIELALAGSFDVIAHGCNCMCNMGAGIAPQMAKAFGCDKYALEHDSYKGDINKLGQIDYRVVSENPLGQFAAWTQGTTLKRAADVMTQSGKFAITVAVVNAYTQYNYGRNHADGDKKPLNYMALVLCLQKINHIFKGKHIGLPKIGAGLAGGDWGVISSIIEGNLKDCKVTIVEYDKS